MTRRRTVSLLLALPIVVALAGCITVVKAPADQPSTAPLAPTSESSEECVATAESGVQRFGDCDELVVEGADLDIEVGTVGTLVVRGDRIEIDSLEVGSLSISGQENDIEIDGDLATLEIAGDRNDVDAEGQIGVAVINGNDNDIEADRGVEVVTDNGSRNTIQR